MKQHKLFWQSSYDRGLDVLLFLWADIRAKYPDAELFITYGWDLFDKTAHNNPERMEWRKMTSALMEQEGITHLGRIGKKELKVVRDKCGIWAYPTYFTEINCITALECQESGCVPVTMALGALSETVKSGVVVQGDIQDPAVKDKYLEELLSLMGDKKRWKKEVKKGKKVIERYRYDKIAWDWHQEFETKDTSTKLTVYTPTVRKGWWNVMAKNLSEQTYKNFEWVIIDDIGYDRTEIAKKYATEYGLDIKIYPGKDRAKKRTYGLVNANNTVMEKAEGEVIVFLQDFIVIPQDGLEQIAFLHRKDPSALIAPCDMYVAPKIKPDIESEDWFHGETDVIGDFIRKNIRIKNIGLRYSDHAFDFEQNYGAIPTKIARELGGWYEFYDEGLGYDNTDIAYRALKKGYKLLVDETNVAVCIDHWEALKSNRENVLGRARRLNDPRYSWAMEMIDRGELPLIRTQEKDDKIDLQYVIPESVSDDDVVKWLKKNGPEVVYNWLHDKNR